MGMDDSIGGLVDLSSDYGTVVGDYAKVASIVFDSNLPRFLTPSDTDISSIASPSKFFKSQVWANRYDEWQPLSNISLGAELGNGRSGVVCKAMYNGRPVALKLCPTHSDRDIINEVFNEVDVYKHLESLQGDYIPRLLTQGLFTHKSVHCFTLVLELIEEAPELRECHESDRADNCPRQARDDAMRAPDRIHSLGVAHKDARMFNVLFEAAGGGLRPRIIDFAFSKVDASQEEINIDRSEWLDVLYLD
ncbi:hypothetical protein GGI07_002980 [Coemansia sp. Benny D115]|nr:hypothetical protein GGI07_002980 [Coemansia sp. Benny D115]